MIHSLRARVVLSLAMVTLTVLGAFVAIVFVLFRDRLRSELDDNLESYATEVIASVQDGASIPPPQIEAGQLGAAVISPDGAVIDSTLPFEGELESEENEEGEENEDGEEGSEGDDHEATELSTTGILVDTATLEGSFSTVSGEHGTQLRAFVTEVETADGALVVATLAPSSSSGSPANRLLVISLVALTSAVIVVVAIAYWVGGLAVRPLHRLSTEVHSLDESSLDERVNVPENADEVAEVANSVNTLLTRIDRSLERERAFVADASHELRNPLASLRAELELSSREGDPQRMRQGIKGAIEETDRLSRLADDLLLLARSDIGDLRIGTISLADVSSTAIVRHAGDAEQAGVDLVLSGDDVTVLGVTGLAERALENLIENALRYAPSDTSVDVSLWAEDRTAGVDVHDRGVGISEEERQRIFDRFARVDTSRARDGGGTGLGLAIVSSVMRAMKGSVELVAAEPEETIFRLIFPRPPEDH